MGGGGSGREAAAERQRFEALQKQVRRGRVEEAQGCLAWHPLLATVPSGWSTLHSPSSHLASSKPTGRRAERAKRVRRTVVERRRGRTERRNEPRLDQGKQASCCGRVLPASVPRRVRRVAPHPPICRALHRILTLRLPCPALASSAVLCQPALEQAGAVVCAGGGALPGAGLQVPTLPALAGALRALAGSTQGLGCDFSCQSRADHVPDTDTA